jgi:D-glycero-alpha-D-manno-heptose 1-phosphate guanylyltransferase
MSEAAMTTGMVGQPIEARPHSCDGLGDVTALILAGGLGTRLRPVVPDRPKVLAPVAGRPFLAYLLDQLADAGIRQVVLCTGHLGEQIRGWLGPAYRGLRVQYSQEVAPLGTGGALRQAQPLIGSGAVLAMNGDSFCEVHLAEFWAQHQKRHAAASILVRWVPDARRFGRVRLDDAGLIRGFDEKRGPEGAGWINAGLYLLGLDLIRTIPSGVAISLEREVLPIWVEAELVHGCPGEGTFLDIGTPESYRDAQAFFRKQASDRGAETGDS